MARRQRLSASVDAELIPAGQAAVAAGTSENLSAWVSDAVRCQADHDRRLAGLGAVLAAFETEHGAIADVEIEQASRWARERAVVVRGAKPTTDTPPAA